MTELTQPRAAAAGPETPSRTRSFVTVFLIEMWERFGYYGMTAVVVLYMVQAVGYNDARANLTFGAFVAMTYAGPAIGGYLGDKVIGTRRMAILGASMLAIGYATLAIRQIPLFVALGIVAVANGVFKANPANLVSKIYEGDPSKTDSAFTMYYMAVNLGSTFSQILTPLFAVWFGWHWAFALCSFGLVLGVINYFAFSRTLAHVGSPPDFAPLNWGKLALVLLGCAAAMVFVTLVIQDLAFARLIVKLAGLTAVVIFGILFAKGNPQERKGVVAVLLLTIQCMVFFIFYAQMSTSLTLFAFRNVELNWLFGYSVPAGQVQVLNPLWIFALSWPLAWGYEYLARKRGGDLSVATKYAIGFVTLAASFFLLVFAGRVVGPSAKISLWWMVLSYGLLSLGELLISGLGLAMVARYVGPKLRGFVMGIWFLATGGSQYLGSFVANIASVPQEVSDPVATLPLYLKLFMGLGWLAVAGTVLSLLMLPILKWLSTPAPAAEPAVANAA
jgi:POT family proton-dependent oligopeptide transporter